MKRIVAIILAGLLLLGSSSLTIAQAKGAKTVKADFSVHTGVPLFKRQNTFSVSYSFGLGSDSSAFFKSVASLQKLRSENMRVDLSMGNGGLGKFFAQGSEEDMTHEFTALDVLLKQLYKNGTQPYFSYTYMPRLLQPENGDFRSPPTDYEAWKRLCSDIAGHYAAQGWPLAAHEIWNEPDLVADNGRHPFYSGTWEEYIRMYDFAARGIREANPLATVGGMSLAFVKYFGQDRIRAFLDHVCDNGLPMDFISYHNYSTDRFVQETDTLNGILSEYGDRFSGLGLHINEFHVLGEWKTEISSNADSACLAMQAIAKLVDMPTVTSVNWATWRDNGEGLNMVDNATGARSAMYHALSVYNDMPIDRVAFEGDKNVYGLASADGSSAGVIVYTRITEDVPLEVRLENLPFERADVRVYAIDKNHSSIYDGCGSDKLDMVDKFEDVPTADLVWSGTLGARGILYFKITPAGESKTLKAVWSLDGDIPIAGETARVLRKEYYFENRQSTMFSEFDLGSFSAWAGMGNADTGTARGSVVMDALPRKLTLVPTLYGEPDDGAGLFLYAEYLDENGCSVSESAWTLGDDVWVPEAFSSGAKALIPGESCELFTPEGFTGILRLSWGLKDAGKDCTLKVRIF